MFPAVTLTKGQSYVLMATTTTGTSYSMLGDHEQDRADAYPDWGSRGFPEGDGQFTTDGTTWNPLYQWAPVDAQCYMVLA